MATRLKVRVADSATAVEGRIISGLLKFGSSMGDDWAKWASRPYAMDHNEANEFVLGLLLDKGVIAERAWDNAVVIAIAFDSDVEPNAMWNTIRRTSPDRMAMFIRYGRRGKALHRFPNKLAEEIIGTARIIDAEFGGDPRRIWRKGRSISKIRETLLRLPGISTNLASMALLRLVQQYGLLGGKAAASQLDVKVDVLVRRVLGRTGLTMTKAPDNEIIDVTRRLVPAFPGALDAPLWKIGRAYCVATRPKCAECPLLAVCPKLDVTRTLSRR